MIIFDLLLIWSLVGFALGLVGYAITKDEIHLLPAYKRLLFYILSGPVMWFMLFFVWVISPDNKNKP